MPTPAPASQSAPPPRQECVPITRFAPSPNGPLHLGHAYSAIRAYDLAHAPPLGGCRNEADRAEPSRFLLRIEDIDGARSKPSLAEDYRADLAWLGLSWDEVAAQSTRLGDYGRAAMQLFARGLLYRCHCSRADIASAARKTGPEGPIYPGTCRKAKRAAGGISAADHACAERDFSLVSDPAAIRDYSWRLDMAAARAEAGPLTWHDRKRGEQKARPEQAGDVILWRKDAPASYHLAATLDDAADGVNLVTRGADLLAATPVHRLLQALLGLPVPCYYHHRLLYGPEGEKLAKRRGAPSLSARRLDGEDGLALAERLRSGNFPAGISAR